MADSIADPTFWRQPMAERMRTFAVLRDASAFTPIEVTHPRFGHRETVYAVTRYAELLEISRRPKDFCSGDGAVSPVNARRRPANATIDPEARAAAQAAGYGEADLQEMEGMDLGMFINMDDPRHARQRGIVARRFTPRHLQGLLDSVETIADELVDKLATKGEADLVTEISEPFPLLVILDMLGIPRSEYKTALKATNAILSAGDPNQLGGDDNALAAIFGSILQLIGLFNEIAEDRRKNPQDDLTSMLVHTDVEE
jgi:cytochrome P450